MNETETVVTVIWEMEYGGRSQVIQSQEQGYIYMQNRNHSEE